MLSQLKKCRRLLDVETQTIDREQGQEFDLVIVNLTLVGDTVNMGITRDLHRLDVMMSRAKMAIV